MDLSWSLKSAPAENKENVARAATKEFVSAAAASTANVSLNSSGVLTVANLNGGGGGGGTGLTGNDSFDSDKIKLDVYEKSFQKLANENKTLRKRVKKLTELARSKEEQLLEAFNEAVEDKRRQEERYKQEHSAQLQSYYECFLQIEKENDALKLKVEQLKQRLADKEAKSSASSSLVVAAASATGQDASKTLESEAGGEDEEETSAAGSHEDKEQKRIRASQINKQSIEQMREELNGVNRSVELFIEDKKASLGPTAVVHSTSSVAVQAELARKSIVPSGAAPSPAPAVDELERRIEELEIEKEALTKKISSIESSLGRWIFRACDYKDELRQMSEKAAKCQLDFDLFRAENEAARENSSRAFAILKQQLDDKYLGEMSHLRAENEVRLVELERSLINKYEAALKEAQTRHEADADMLNGRLERQREQLAELGRDYEEAVRRAGELEASLERWSGRRFGAKETQTSAADFETAAGVSDDLSAPPQTPTTTTTLNKNKSESCVMSAAANVASRFGLRSVNAKTTTPTTTAATPASGDAVDVAESEIKQLHKRLEQSRCEVAALKLKIDQLVLEKKSLQCRNDELASDLDKASRGGAGLHQAPTPAPAQVSKATNTSTASKNVQTMSTTVSSQTQTQQLPHSISQSNANETIQSLRIKIEVYKSEMETLQAKSAKELHELKRSLEERCATAHAECLKLEARLVEQNKSLDEMTRLNASLKQKLDEFEQMHCQSELKYEEELMRLQQDSSREKQISDTIIMQQKKLLNFLQLKLGPGAKDVNVGGSGGGGSHETASHHNHLASIFKWKSSSSSSSSHHLGANISKPTPIGGSKQSKQAKSSSSSSKTSSNSAKNSASSAATNRQTTTEIEAALNSNYQVYSDLKKMQSNNTLSRPDAKAKGDATAHSSAQNNTAAQTNGAGIGGGSKRQIHVFITGLNTCPTYCHVCQHLIPLIAYASKCQLCSFTCHSTCSSSAVQSAAINSNPDDPLKYCHNNYMMDSFGYTYIQKLASMPLMNVAPGSGQPLVQSTSELNNYYRNNFLIADSLYIYVDKKWKKIWMVLRLDGNLDLYQSSTNHKPFDTINLALDRVQFETSASKIVKIVGSSTASTPMIGGGGPSDEENIYEQPDLAAAGAGKFKPEISPPLVILLYGPQLCLQIGFTSFAKKNIWYDALQSSSMLAPSTIQKRSLTALQAGNGGGAGSSGLELARLNVNNVLKPFLELCDTTVNSYCFISEHLIALACDDGLYVLDSPSSCQAANISLAKVETIESAHKLFYHGEFSKLCFIGRKSRQFLCIDVEELLKASSESASQPRSATANNMGLDADDDDEINLDEDDEETRAVSVRIERIQNIDRCHLFECTMINGVWYIAVATPETIYVLLFNRHLNKFSFVKSISTTDAPCLCLKFTSKLTNQLVYGCKEFYAMDMTYLQSTPVLESGWNKKQEIVLESEVVLRSGAQNVISLCIVSSTNDQEALLLCFEDYGLFVTYNSASGGWSLGSKSNKTTNTTSTSAMPSLPSSASSGALAAAASGSGTATTSHVLKWPRGGGVPPLQVEYDAPFLYLFYNDSIVVYNISFNVGPGLGELDLVGGAGGVMGSYLPVVKRVGIAFVYKPRYLGNLHTRDANCLIISNRRPLDQSLASPASSQFSEINKYQQAGAAILEEDDDSDAKSSSTKVPNATMAMQEFTDKICLSYFDTLAN